MQLPERRAYGDLPQADWDWTRKHLPISCTDVLPIIVDQAGLITHVGLISRELDGREVWCHVGGRVFIGETLLAAACRHITNTLSIAPERLPAVTPTPFFVNQYLPTHTAGCAFDPTMHAVAVCFTLPFPERVAIVPRETGEATAFEWFPLDHLPHEDDLSPGCGQMLRALPPNNLELAYEALNADCISHNELMWQTPALAMTAMAFLLTIALGGGPAWARALAGALSAFVSLTSAQLMAKHSVGQLDKTRQLEAIEHILGMPTIHGKPVHETPGGHHGVLETFEQWLARPRSRHLWLLVLLLFGAVSCAAVVIAFLP